VRETLRSAILIRANVIRPALWISKGAVLAVVIGTSASVLLAVVAITTGVLTVLFLYRPELVLLFLVAVRPLVDAFVYQDVRWRSLSIDLGRFWGIVLLVALVAYLLRNRPPPPALRAYAVPALFLIGYFALTIGRHGHDTGMTLGGRLAVITLLVMAIEGIASSARGQALVVFAVYSGAVMSIIAVSITLMRDRYGLSYYNDVLANDQAPLAFAAYATLLLPFLAGAILAGAPRVLPSTLAILLVGAVVLSFSRTMYVALAIVLVAVIVAAIRWRRSYGLLLLGGAVGASIVTVALFFDRIVGRIAHGGTRFDVWSSVFQGVISQLRTTLVGGGAEFSMQLNESGYTAHDGALEMFSTGGLVLIMLYAGLIFWMGRAFVRFVLSRSQSRRARNFGLVCFGGFCAFLAMDFFDEIVFNASAGVLIGLLAGLTRGMNSTPGRTFIDEGWAMVPSLRLLGSELYGRPRMDNVVVLPGPDAKTRHKVQAPRSSKQR
jgi:hypothetical protein